jgi:hypothetical protein
MTHPKLLVPRCRTERFSNSFVPANSANLVPRRLRQNYAGLNERECLEQVLYLTSFGVEAGPYLRYYCWGGGGGGGGGGVRLFCPMGGNNFRAYHFSLTFELKYRQLRKPGSLLPLPSQTSLCWSVYYLHTRNTCMQQPLAYIFQTLFQHEVFVITPTLNAGSRCTHVSHGCGHGDTIIVF